MPAKPFKVFVTSYSLESDNVGGARRFEYQSDHASAGAAARRLANIIARKSPLAKSIQAAIGQGRSGVYKVIGADGVERALIPHRRHYGMTSRPRAA